MFDRWCLGPAGLKAVRPSLAHGATFRSLNEGATAAARRSERGVPRSGFASGSLPQSRSTGSITNAPRPASVMPRCGRPRRSGACAGSRDRGPVRPSALRAPNSLPNAAISSLADLAASGSAGKPAESRAAAGEPYARNLPERLRREGQSPRVRTKGGARPPCGAPELAVPANPLRYPLFAPPLSSA